MCDSGESVASAMGRDSGDGPRDSGLREGGGSRSVVEASVACMEVFAVKKEGGDVCRSRLRSSFLSAGIDGDGAE